MSQIHIIHIAVSGLHIKHIHTPNEQKILGLVPRRDINPVGLASEKARKKNLNTQILTVVTVVHKAAV